MYVSSKELEACALNMKDILKSSSSKVAVLMGPHALEGSLCGMADPEVVGGSSEEWNRWMNSPKEAFKEVAKVRVRGVFFFVPLPFILKINTLKNVDKVLSQQMLQMHGFQKVM